MSHACGHLDQAQQFEDLSSSYTSLVIDRYALRSLQAMYLDMYICTFVMYQGCARCARSKGVRASCKGGEGGQLVPTEPASLTCNLRFGRVQDAESQNERMLLFLAIGMSVGKVFSEIQCCFSAGYAKVCCTSLL